MLSSWKYIAEKFCRQGSDTMRNKQLKYAMFQGKCV